MTAYLFKIILCSAIFMLVYSLFLEKEKMYKFNRFYLLGSIFFSLLIPSITIKITKNTPLQEVNNFVFFPDNFVSEPTPVIQIETVPTYVGKETILLLGYLLVTSFFLIRFLISVYRLCAKIRRTKCVPYEGSYLILIEEELTPHSFLNYIFLNKKAFENGNIEKEILHHELTHVKQRHTIDILLTEIIAAFLWFNPFIYLYKRAIKINHEFLADEGVINKFHNVSAYQYLLLDKTNQQSALAITSQFNFLITKKRLIMITKYTSRRIAIVKQSLAVITMTAAVFIFSAKAIEAQQLENDKEPQNQMQTPVAENVVLQDTIKPEVHFPFYPGGTKEGVSQDLLDEYHTIIDRNKTPEKSWYNFREKINPTDKKRLEEIFVQMSLSQQQHESVIFMKPFPPLPKIVPTEKQFNNFKNAKVYGVWVNEKKVLNSTLNQYTAKDISHFDISKLYGGAKKGRIYSYQVNMMTNKYFDEFNAKKLADKTNTMVFQAPRPVRK